MLVSHSKSVTIADNTALTDIVRPSDWNSAHVGKLTIVGNTSNQSSWSGSNLVISANSGIIAGISADSLFLQGPVIEGFDPLGGIQGEFIAGQIGNASLFFVPVRAYCPWKCDRVVIPLILSHATNATLTMGLSISVGLYSKNNSTQITRLTSYGSYSVVTASGTASSSIINGLRNYSFGIGTTAIHGPGNYVLALFSRTSTGGANMSVSNLIMSNLNSAYSGLLTGATNTSHQFTAWHGSYSNTVTVMPDSVAASQLRGSAAAAIRGVIFRFEFGSNA